ncbi:MAG: hypothetical protein IPK80_00940 [Nannocystis sp.]|nr:hypothetical protein [Nannocystis sp.]
MLDHALAAAGAPPDLIVDDARAMLLRAARGLPRLISHLLRLALVLADEREQPRIDASIMNSAIILLHLEPHSPPPLPLCRVDLSKSARPDLWGERVRRRLPRRPRTPAALGVPHPLLPDKTRPPMRCCASGSAADLSCGTVPKPQPQLDQNGGGWAKLLARVFAVDVTVPAPLRADAARAPYPAAGQAGDDTELRGRRSQGRGSGIDHPAAGDRSARGLRPDRSGPDRLRRFDRRGPA